MFERFTDRARRVVVLAQAEARLLQHNYIGTEHLLLGLIQEGDGVAARALRALDVEFDDVRAGVLTIVGEGHAAPPGHIPFTPRAKKVLEMALREAQQLGHSFIGTEHILLGLLREGAGVGAQILNGEGITLSVARQEVAGVLGATGTEPVEAVPGEGTEAPQSTPAWRVERIGPGTSLRRAHGEGERPPSCPRCDADLTESARYLVRDVPPGRLAGEDSTEDAPSRKAAFLFCTECGRLVAANLLDPDEES